MNRQMNLPALQRIAMEFEKENDIMDQRQEMMDDAIDDVTGLEDEEEGEEVVQQVLDEIGIDLGQAVSASIPSRVSAMLTTRLAWRNTVRSPEDRRGRRPGRSGSWRRGHGCR
jgi:division protein CdvB (Snf7/Vps24/ESCRT-III family)